MWRVASVVVLAVAASSCYSPSLTEGFACATDKPDCPGGFVCEDRGTGRRCWAGHSDTDGGTTTDGTVLPDGPPPAPPRNLGLGRRVAAARFGTSVRVAWEDPDRMDTGTGLTAIRLVDIDNKGKLGPVTTLVNRDKVRNDLIADGDRKVYLGWIEGTADIASQTFIGQDGNGTQIVVGTGGDYLNRKNFDVTASGDIGFYVSSHEPSPSQGAIQVRRVGGNDRNMEVYRSAPGSIVTELDAQVGDDGVGLFIGFVETQVVTTGNTTTTVKVLRVNAADLSRGWGSVDKEIARDVTLTGKPRLRRPRVSVSARAGLVMASCELELATTSSTPMQIFQLGTGNSVQTARVDSTGSAMPLTVPVGASPAVTNGAAFLVGLRPGVGSVRGSIVRSQFLPSMAAGAEIGQLFIAPYAVADELNNLYFFSQAGGDVTGELLVFSSSATWPTGGVQPSQRPGKSRPMFTGARRSGGGLVLEWTETSDTHTLPLVQAQTYLPDGTGDIEMP